MKKQKLCSRNILLVTVHSLKLHVFWNEGGAHKSTAPQLGQELIALLPVCKM